MSHFAFRTALVLTLAAAALPALAQAPVQKPSQGQMKAAVSAYFDAMNAGDADKAKAAFSAGAMIEDPVGAALRSVGEFVPRVIGQKGHFTTVLMTGSNLNFVTAAVTLSRPDGSGVNAIELFTFDPDGKISGLKVYAGTEDRKAANK